MSSAAEVSLSDISGNTYENAITYLVGEGVVEGYPDGTYKPNQTINRAELLKIILEASNADTSAASNSCFPDVQGDDWYVKYVCTAQSLGIVEGYPDGTFKPAQTVNFVEALKITELGYGLNAGAESEPWYKRYVDTASGYNMIPLEISSFGAGLTRGQMADMITRLNKHQDETQDQYLQDSFGDDWDTVIDYQTIESRDQSSSNLQPSNLPSAEIETFSTNIPAVTAMNFTADINESSTGIASAENYSDVLDYLEVNLSPEQEDFLDQNKFLLIPIENTKLGDIYVDYDEMLGALDKIGGEYSPSSREAYNTRLITTDAVLHAYHKFFENSLEKLEKEELGQKLRSFTEKLQQRAFACKDTSTNTELQERCEYISAQITVARILLENAQWDKPDYFDSPEDQAAWEANDPNVDSIENAKAMLQQYQGKFSAQM